MRFLLFENTASRLKITPELVKQYQYGNETKRETILRKILNNYGSSGRYNTFYDVFKVSCELYGIDPEHNIWLETLPTLIESVNATNKHVEYFHELIQMHRAGIISDDSLEAINNA